MTLILSSIAALIAVVVYWASPTIRNYRLSQALAPIERSAHTGDETRSIQHP